ncbi:MAG: HsmA family protein [Patescibacteria group bacterium]
MLIPVLLICAALILYTTAIWTEKFQRILRRWMVTVFALGFTCDLAGTSAMVWRSIGQPLDVHECAGVAALVIMALHLGWATLALVRGGQYSHLFSRYSVYAWGVWLIAFITGVPQ